MNSSYALNKVTMSYIKPRKKCGVCSLGPVAVHFVPRSKSPAMECWHFVPATANHLTQFFRYWNWVISCRGKLSKILLEQASFLRYLHNIVANVQSFRWNRVMLGRKPRLAGSANVKVNVIYSKNTPTHRTLSLVTRKTDRTEARAAETPTATRRRKKDNVRWRF